eukprot:3495175-Prymnesium_polylepis.1
MTSRRAHHSHRGSVAWTARSRRDANIRVCMARCDGDSAEGPGIGVEAQKCTAGSATHNKPLGSEPRRDSAI